MSAPDPSLDKLADIALPPAVSWMPQTWGWAALAAIALIVAAWVFVRWRKRMRANRYRVEAIEAMVALEARLDDAGKRAEAMAALAPIIKRAALAGWPRMEVAHLAGTQWVEFLRAHGGAPVAEPLARLLDDMQYRPAIASMSAEDAKACTRAARQWIEEHHVSA